MTPEEARALDREVAEKVMGLVPCDGYHLCSEGTLKYYVVQSCTHESGTCFASTETVKGWVIDNVYPPHYSTDMNYVWGVVQYMVADGFTFSLNGPDVHGEWSCVFRCWDEPCRHGDHVMIHGGVAKKSSVTESICRAALAAVAR